jgi:hypothetical protein
MTGNRRNSSSGIMVLFLVFVFFSLIHLGKERQITRTATHPSAFSDTHSARFQANIAPAPSAPGIDIHRINTLKAKFASMFSLSGREFAFNHPASGSLNSYHRKFHFRNPILCFFSLQKVPEQGTNDDLPSLA